MQRRVEAQFRRDWTFGFAVWNYLFRTAVNLQKNAYMFSAPSADGGSYQSLKPEDIVAGVREIASRLRGTYTDINGEEKPVQGDLTKLRFANLKPAARKILANVEARDPRGAQDHAPPDPRLSRLLRDLDLLDFLAFGARGLPALDEEFCRLSPEALAENLPNYEDRTLVLLTLRHLLGVRFCPRCPNCATSGQPCSDAFGSNAVAGGGVLGRVDAPSYASYTAHVRRSVYCDPEGWERDRAAEAYQASRRLRPEEWTRRHLAEDVEQLQQRKQHHVHLPAGPGSKRRPLAHCRNPKDPTRRKSGFPRDRQLILGRTALVCRSLAEQLVKGKRSSLGLQWGPVNDPNLAVGANRQRRCPKCRTK
ncbi:unnamed protein product [Effrenium voratum]|uniref:Uncharacterized protein n=1 Tax=Effrenium voratum TaxID=2562239 RepID=A0AA36N0P3_9DINO|nr:unnamed protein product [Effrenium voratum]